MKNAPNHRLEASAWHWIGQHVWPQFAYPIILVARSQTINPRSVPETSG